jgi:hypothetical protein
VQLFVDFLKVHLVPQFLRSELQLDDISPAIEDPHH